MKSMAIGNSGIAASRVIYGCMNLGGVWDRNPVSAEAQARAEKAVGAALEAGITMFDHADIYTFGKSEEVFGRILAANPGLRSKLTLQTKCAVRFPGEPDAKAPLRYDNGAEHILRSVDASLKRLQTDYVDILLIHRPDPLMEPEEIARTFDGLHREGKVRYFGVSNFSAAQMAVLSKSLSHPLVANQLEVSLLHIPLIDDSINVNLAGEHGAVAGGTLEYCQMNGITIQAWAPLARGVPCDPARCRTDIQKKVAETVGDIAAERKVSKEAIVLAWLLRHPAGIRPIIGTASPDRIRACCEAEDVVLSREEWNRLYVAARGRGLY